MDKRILVLLSLLLSVASTAAQDWNQWRGPARTGAAPSFTVPAVWPDRPKQVWKVTAGSGHASPVVADGRVYLLSRVSDREAVTAFDLVTGRQIWRQEYEAPYQMNPAATGHGKGPKSTPLVAGGRVFTFGITGVLSAWDTSTGRLIWRKDFAKDFPTTAPDFGTAVSPLLAGNLLVIHAGGSGNGALLAVDPVRGNPKWSWKEDGPGYASPIVAAIGGTRQIITQSQRHVIGLSMDGRLLWQIPFVTEYEQNILTPVVSGNLLIYGGVSKPTRAVKIVQQAGGWTTQPVWENADIPMYMSTPVEVGGYLFGLTQRNRGQFFCAEVATGKTVWTTRGREGENASLIVAGDLLIATTTEGEVVFARASPKAFEPVKRYTVADSPIWAHPAPARRGLLIKDAETLSYWVF